MARRATSSFMVMLVAQSGQLVCQRARSRVYQPLPSGCSEAGPGEEEWLALPPLCNGGQRAGAWLWPERGRQPGQTEQAETRVT